MIGAGTRVRVRPGPGWDRDRRDTLLLLTATLMAAAPHLPHLPLWTSAAFGALFLWRVVLAITGRPLPSDLLRWIAVVACGAALLVQYGTVLGSEPGVATLVLAMGLKLLELRARRDLFVVIFLGFFLLLTGFFHTQSLANAALTLAGVTALLLAMQTMQFGAQQPTLARRLRAVALLMLQAAPIAAALFLLFPRISGPLWRMPLDASRGTTGLSDAMSPGQIAALTLSDETAFRVRFDATEPERAQLYWRGPVLGHYDGRTWRPTGKTAAQEPAATISAEPADRLRYTVTLEPSARPWLLALETPVQLLEAPPGGGALTSERQLLAREPVTQRVRYRVESAPERWRADDDAARARARYLQLPAGANPRSLALAARWRESVADDPTRIRRVLAQFREEPFRYTMTPGALGRDAVDAFLFDTRAGFCEHYAAALVVLARGMGIPARVVTGYYGGERNPLTGEWTVRQADAHAWAEVWIDGQGWMRVDPTAAIDPARIEPGLRSGRTAPVGDAAQLDWRMRMRFSLDAIASTWNHWVLAYDAQRQTRLLERLGLEGRDWRATAGLLAATLALGMAGVALVMLRRRRAADPAVRCYEAFCRQLARHGIVRRPDDTPAKLLERARTGLGPEAAGQAERIIALYGTLRYGRPEGSRAEHVRHLRTLIRSFRP